jgi:signal transduction histidine kinase
MDRRFERTIGIVMWLMVGLPAVLDLSGDRWRLAIWTTAFLLFGVLLALCDRWPGLWLPAIETVAVLAMVLVRCNGFEGTLLVLVALQLGARTTPRLGILWIIAQTLLLGGAIATHWSVRPALMLTPPYFGFQLLAFTTIASTTRLAAASRELGALHERLRISQELHDALGHRLTALTLNLEAALRRIEEGPARQNIEVAQSLARGLLADVREIVAMNQSRAGDLAQALERLIDGVPRPAVHLQIAAGLRVEEPERRHILVRAVQEIITNAARHAQAENLWIVVERAGDALRIRAHDDGRGTTGGADGAGLRGMRERLERAGGTLSITSDPGRGFDVIATLPGLPPPLAQAATPGGPP